MKHIIRIEKEDEYEYKEILPREELREEYLEPLSIIYEHLYELELNKPIGRCKSYEKKLKYYREALKKFEV